VTTKPIPDSTTARRTRERAEGSQEHATRDRVVKAAIECITDLGFYRGSSTNEIARKAGVTWGVIQHYFGNREGLMLAVLEHGAGHMVATVEEAHIDGSSAAERLEQLVELFSTHYARPEYLASLQILLNMDHDPRTSADVRKTMSQVAERSHAHIRRLLGEALGPSMRVPELATTIFLVIRGFGFSQLLMDSMAYDTVTPKRDRAALQRQLLADMLSPYVEMLALSDP
jgi:AcrR family transcriptional regulator